MFTTFIVAVFGLQHFFGPRWSGSGYTGLVILFLKLGKSCRSSSEIHETILVLLVVNRTGVKQNFRQSAVELIGVRRLLLIQVVPGA